MWSIFRRGASVISNLFRKATTRRITGEWCRSHGTEECDESAEFYIEQTEAEMMDRQVMDDGDYGIWL